MAVEGLLDNVVLSQNSPQSQLNMYINFYDFPHTDLQMLARIKKISRVIDTHN